MKKTNAFKSAFLILTLFFAGKASAFDWPISDFDPEQKVLDFGQKRKDSVNTALVFGNAQNAKASDSGKIIAVITEHQGDGDWFETPLGNAIILSHDDSLISVYGNLSEQSALDLEKKSDLKTGEDLGSTGNSAWNESAEENSLEFQIADTNAKTFINPTILMPRALKPKRILLEDISIENQFGRLYGLASLRSVPAGKYKVYKKRQADAVTFKSEVYVNGSEVEKITKDTIKSQKGLLTISGATSYTSKDFYPNEEMEFLGCVFLPHGSNTVTIRAADFYDNARIANYNISAY
ncbi:MAG: M23 family metallopeptidase [Treponema sp.]|nr:M23 family metallopeptidase [Treponema sp.]